MSLIKLSIEKIILLGISIIVVIVVAFFVATNIHLLGRLLHIVFPPINLYAPIIVDENFRWDLEKSSSYEIPCSYYDIYEVGMRTDRKVLPSGLFVDRDKAFKFKGKLQIRIFRDTKIVYEAIAFEPLAIWFFKEDDNYISHSAFMTFPMPLYCEGLKLEVTLLVPDKNLQLLASPQLYVRVSPIP